MFIGMVVRSETIGPSCSVQFDMAAKDMGKRTRLQKIDNSQGAFAVSCGVFNQQSTRQQKISRKKNGGSVVVKCHVRLVVPRRGNYVHRSAASIDLRDSIRPLIETEERSNTLQIQQHTPHSPNPP